MTVKELIEKLSVMPKDAEVLQLGDNATAKVVGVHGVLWSGLLGEEAKYPKGVVGVGEFDDG